MQALFSLGVTVVAATSIMLFYVFDKSTSPEETPLIGDHVFNKEAGHSEGVDMKRDGKPSGFRMDGQETQTGEATSQVKLKEEAGRQKKAKEAEAAAQAKKKEEAEHQKKAKEAEAAARAKQEEEAERQKKAKEAEAIAKAKLKEEAEHQKKTKEAEAAAQAKKKEDAERQKKAKEAEAATQAKLKEEAKRQKKAKEAEATAQAKKKEEAERQKKAKEAEATAQAKKKEEAERQKKAKEAEAAAQTKKKEEAERQKKAKDAETAAQAKKKEEAERQKKAKEAEATAQAKLKEETERQKKAKEAEAAAQAKLKEEAKRQKKAKEAEAASQAKKKEEAERQKKAKEAEAAARAMKKEEAERQKKAKDAETTAQAKKKEEAEHQKKAKEAEAAAQAKLKEETERQKKAKEAEAAAQAKLKEEAKRQKKAKEVEAAAQAKKKEEAERQKKAKEAEAAAQAKKKEDAERQKKAKEVEAAAQAKKKEDAERQKKAKEAEAAAQAKLKEETERQKKAKEAEAAAQAKLKEEAERQKKAKEAEAAAQAKKKEEAEHQKKAKEAEAAAQAKKKEEAERQKKAKDAETAAQAKKKEEAERQKKAKEAEAATQAKKNEEAESQKEKRSVEAPVNEDIDKTVHLAVVACGERLEEPLVMIKSAVLLTQAVLHVHIFADDGLRPQFKSQLESWPSWVRSKFKYSLYEIQFPPGENFEQWKKLFKLCASQRLFLPYVLKDLTGVLYVDTDILFMRPVENIWRFFKRFNSTQIAALTPEHETPNAGWYNRFARHPYYGKLGVNSGVMLINLTRMREAKWKEHIVPYYQKYRFNITWGDQDLINIFFHYYPEKLYVYPCNWNYRPDHCMYGSDCKPAEDWGVSVLHGNRQSFHTDKQPAFKAIYETVRDFQFGDDLETKLLGEMRRRFQAVDGKYCGTLPNVFFTQLERQIKLLKSAKKPVSEEDVGKTKQVADSKERKMEKQEKEEGKEQRVAGATKENIPSKKNEKEAVLAKDPKGPIMHLAVVACGNRFAETLVLLKSAVLLTRAKIFFHIFADDDLRPQFKLKMSEWPKSVLRQVTYKVHPLRFPDDNTGAWKKLFKPCASQRLFLANILEDVDALLYVDTDVLFFTPLEDIWAHFDAFNSTQMAALAGEMEDTQNSWYKNFARHPYYLPLGVNSGVMLMNLTRMRQVDWLAQIIPYYEEYKYRITWGDQDLINIYFHHFPERLYVYSCKWNYRHDHCIYMDVCKAVKETGVSILHGCRRIFQNDKEPAFRAIYLAMEEHKFGDDLGKLLNSMKERYRTAAHTNCGQMERHFFQQFERHIAARKRDKA